MSDFAGEAVLAILVTANWVAAYLLVRASKRRPELRWLRERAVTAVILVFGSIIGLLLYINRINGDAWLPLNMAPILGIPLLVFSCIPALYWLSIYVVRGRLDE